MKKMKGILSLVAALVLVAMGYLNMEDITEIFLSENASENISIEETVAAGEMKVWFLDVGQGDCTIIQTNEGCMMVDAGNNEWGNEVTAFLEEQGIEKLDYLILTHPDADHIGGADDVLETVEVDKVLMPEVENDTMTYEEVVNDIEQFGIEVIYPEVEETYGLGDAEFTILCPDASLISKDDLNGSSVGIKLVHGKNSFVLCGDAEEKSELTMAEYFGESLACDVLKCGHHGSSTATTDEFLQMTDPTWAVISCGEGNSYGHPHAEVLSKLEDADVQILRTDKQGTVEATSDGDNIYWTSDR